MRAKDEGDPVSADFKARSVSRAWGVDRVRALQRVLYRCAKQDRDRRFHALFDKVARSDELVRPVHNRMPVVFADPELWPSWLHPSLDGADARELLASVRVDGTVVRPASLVGELRPARRAGLPRLARRGVAGVTARRPKVDLPPVETTPRAGRGRSSSVQLGPSVTPLVIPLVA
jgi:hypothetical protein